MPLDLLIPDLLLPADAPPSPRALRLPALEKWLARADLEHGPGGDAIEWLAAAYALPAPAPVAAVALAGEEAALEGTWMRADPVHLRIDHDYLKLHDASILAVTREEAAALVAALQAHFVSDGLEFHARAPDRWYVRVPADEAPATTPLARALRRDIFGLLPSGGRRINWRAAITEAQMVLGAHEVNARREAAGRPPINSVWLWGEGALPADVPKRYALLYADDVFARGLGVLSGAEVRPLAHAIGEVDLVRAGEAALAVVGGLTGPLRSGDDASWKSVAEALDARWFAGLGDAIARFERIRLVFPAGESTRVATLTRSSRWRWFRSRKPLAAHA